MQRKIIMGLLASSVVLSGCLPYSEAPRATNFPSEDQRKLQAASHWQLIAQDSAEQLIAALPEKKPLHVRQSELHSEFEKAFTVQLITSLTRAGYPVMKSADHPGTLLVDVSANPVRFSRGRQQPGMAGKLTALTAGLWVLRELERVSDRAAPVAGIVALDALEWFGSETSFGATPQTELMITATISTEERYLAQTSSIYYTVDRDLGLYAQSSPGVVMPVRGVR